MKLALLILCALTLGGCTVTVVDSRLSREEVAKAFQQRDQVLETIVAKLKALEPKKESKK